MTEVKISELPSASFVDDNDTFVIVQSGTTKKVTKSNLGIPLGYVKELVWENADTSQSISANTDITVLSIEPYDYLEVVFASDTSSLEKNYYSFSDSGEMMAIAHENNGTAIKYRSIVIQDNTTIRLGQGYYALMDSNMNTYTQNNVCIPAFIYGIKIGSNS